MKISSIQSNISFQRQLTPVEKIENRIQTDEAKKVIGLKNLVLITHTQSLPSSPDEDTGIGVLSLNKGAKSYINFAYDNGIDAISIEPPGIIKGEFYSPYDSSVLSKKNVIDIKALTEDKWANILDINIYDDIVKNKDYNVSVPIMKNGIETGEKTVKFDRERVIYDYALKAHNKALKNAWNNFKFKLENEDAKAVELNSEFEKFKQENDYYLKGDSIYSVLSLKYGSSTVNDWSSILHQTLFDSEDMTYSEKEKKEEINRLEKEYEEEIQFYKFCQFVVNKQQNEFTDYAMKLGRIRYKSDIDTIERAYKAGEISKEKYEYLKQGLWDFNKNVKGVNIIGDKQIGYSSMDIWSNPSLFTKDEYMGAPPNLIKGSLGQDWNFKFIPREKLFNQDGSLNDGGKYLKQTIKKAFEDYPGGLRIDHILGMIDPWTYNADFENKISPIKFNALLLTALKDLKELNINQETMAGINNPIDVITNEESEERNILIERGVVDFDKACKIIRQNSDAIEKMQYSNVSAGRRYMFNYLLNNDLKELKNLGFNEQTISGVLDPIRGIIDENSTDRMLFISNGIKEFDKASQIIKENKDNIIKFYSKILEDIVLEAGKEVIKEREDKLGLNLSCEEIQEKTRSLLICEDLGSLTIPLREVMKKLKLSGMRNAVYSNPYDENHIYREINPNEQGNYWIIGSHDSKPYEVEIQRFSAKEREANADYISREMKLDKALLIDKNNSMPYVRAKAARIFAADNNPKTSNNVILNWLDLFGIKKSYNTPGKLDKENNWNLRVSPSNDSFERKYFEDTLPSKRGLNIPEILSKCIVSAGLERANERLNEELKITAHKIEE